MPSNQKVLETYSQKLPKVHERHADWAAISQQHLLLPFFYFKLQNKTNKTESRMGTPSGDNAAGDHKQADMCKIKVPPWNSQLRVTVWVGGGWEGA